MEIKSNYSIFDYTSLLQGNREQQSKNALGNAIDLYQDGNYKKAIMEFQRSIALSPNNENIVETYNYMANVYLKLDDPKNAEKAYKNALSVDPQREDMHLNLGNLYFSMGKNIQAEQSYRNAVRVYPSSENYYSLAHCCLETGKLDESQQLFEKTIRMEPKSENGYYGLGMTFAKKGDNEAAIKQFEKALERNSGFDDARVELGYMFADLGNIEKANEQYEILKENESNLASLLYLYMHKVEKPKFTAAYKGDFNWNLSMRTPVSYLNSYLRIADEKSYFTVRFSFNKDMDTQSIQNPDHWKLSAAAGYGPKAYNFGLKSTPNEINIPDKPESILYDPESRTAIVKFALQQNENANGIIDPSHVVFSFSGVDRFGNKMDEKYDSFSKFNGFA
ncbi:MAG: tetratricopeptide repeat protein [Desulfobacteraceae bacterium]|nr:tetratricopeptide repeat protein [Desulfobacteraceae bacterium]